MFEARNLEFPLGLRLGDLELSPALTSIHSRAIRRWSWSLRDSRSTSPSLRLAEAPPSSCATIARVPIRRDDKATPPAAWPIATGGSPDRAASLATRGRDAAPYCPWPYIPRKSPHPFGYQSRSPTLPTGSGG